MILKNHQIKWYIININLIKNSQEILKNLGFNSRYNYLVLFPLKYGNILFAKVFINSISFGLVLCVYIWVKPALKYSSIGLIK